MRDLCIEITPRMGLQMKDIFIDICNTFLCRISEVLFQHTYDRVFEYQPYRGFTHVICGLEHLNILHLSDNQP